MPTDPAPAQTPRPKFDTLFADPRHYRGDCRLMVTAIRRGWLAAAPQADRDALTARFETAMAERWATEPPHSKPRALFAEVAAMLAMDRDNMAPVLRELRYGWTGATTGRPRERYHVYDHPIRLDAAAIQRAAERDGVNPLTIGGLTVNHRTDDGERTDTVGAVATPDTFRRVKLWLVCPRCGRRRLHLYTVRAGVRCRACAGIGYGPKRDHPAIPDVRTTHPHPQTPPA